MNFTVYSKHSCPYCQKIKTVLNDLSVRKGYVITCYELDTHFDKDSFYAEFGEGSTFPQVVLDQTHLGGCADTVKYLQENKLL
jgi:glutaredoxin